MSGAIGALYRLLFGWMEGVFSAMWDIAMGKTSGIFYFLLENWVFFVVLLLIVGTLVDFIVYRTLLNVIVGVRRAARSLYGFVTGKQREEPELEENDEPDTWRDQTNGPIAYEPTKREEKTTRRY